MATPKVTNWIRAQLAHGEMDADYVSRLVLRHQTPSAGIGSDIRNLKITRKTPEGVDIEQLISAWANELEQAAQDDADGLSGAIQQYMIFSFTSLDRDCRRPVSRCPLKVSKPLEDDGRGAALYRSDQEMNSEPPNMQGLVMQLMRHSEAKERTLVTGISQILNGLSRENQRMQQMVERSMDRDLELMKTLENMHSEKHERELATATAVKQEERKSEAFSKVMMLLPNVVNRITGKQILPEKTTPLTEMVDQLGSSIKDTQVEKLMEVFDGDQQLLLFSILNATREKQAREKAEREKEARERVAHTEAAKNGQSANGTKMPSDADTNS